jgi:hypothetical protein
MRLAAAAPEMRDALKRVERWLEPRCDGYELYKKVLSALEKAGG